VPIRNLPVLAPPLRALAGGECMGLYPPQSPGQQPRRGQGEGSLAGDG